MPTDKSLRLNRRLTAALKAFQGGASDEALYAPFRALRAEMGDKVRAYPYMDPDTGKRGILVYHERGAVVPAALLHGASHIEEGPSPPKSKGGAKSNTVRKTSFGGHIPEPTLPPESVDDTPARTRFDMLLEDD